MFLIQKKIFHTNILLLNPLMKFAKLSQPALDTIDTYNLIKFHTVQEYYDNLLRFSKVDERGFTKFTPDVLPKITVLINTKEDVQQALKAYYNFLGHHTIFPQRFVDQLLSKIIDTNEVDSLLEILEFHQYIMYYPHPGIIDRIIEFYKQTYSKEKVLHLSAILKKRILLKASGASILKLISVTVENNNAEAFLNTVETVLKRELLESEDFISILLPEFNKMVLQTPQLPPIHKEVIHQIQPQLSNLLSANNFFDFLHFAVNTNSSFFLIDILRQAQQQKITVGEEKNDQFNKLITTAAQKAFKKQKFVPELFAQLKTQDFNQKLTELLSSNETNFKELATQPDEPEPEVIAPKVDKEKLKKARKEHQKKTALLRKKQGKL